MAFGEIFGDSSFNIDVDAEDPVSELGRVLKKCSDLKLGTAATDAVIQKFMESFGQLANSANYCAKPLETMVKNAEKLRDALKGNGIFSKDVARQLKDSVQAQTLNYTRNQSPLNDLRRMDLLRNAGFDDNETNGLTSTSRMQRIARLTTYITSLSRSMFAFADRTAKANRELFLLASHAQSAVKDIASMGGALEAYGGTKGQAANEKRQFEIEMARMARGQGTGGKYIEAARLYGIEFKPNDFEAQQKEYIKFLSNPNVSKTDKVGFAALMGYDSHQVAMMSQGVEAYEKEVALQKSLHKNAEAAAEASQRYMVASQHLSAQIEDVKNAAMIPILKVLTPLKELAARHPLLAGAVGAFGGAMKVGGELLRLKAYWNLAFGGGGGLLGGGAAAAGTAGNAAGSVAGAVSKFAGGAAGVAGSLAGAVTGLMGEQVLLDIRGLLNSWFAIWCVMNGATGNKTNSKDVIARALEDLPEFGIGAFNDRARMQFASNMAGENYFRQVENRQAIMAFNRAQATVGENGQKSTTVTIEQISINVQSDSANPTDVAQAVHEHLLREMRDVVISLDPGGTV